MTALPSNVAINDGGTFDNLGTFIQPEMGQTVMPTVQQQWQRQRANRPA